MASATQASQFIEKIAPLIQGEGKRRGYTICSPIIAQACLESAFGTSVLAYKHFNFFGLKTGSKWRGKSVNMKTKEEYTTGTLTTIRDNFRVYDNMADGVRGYFDFVSTPRYANLKDAATPREYLERIKADGYATSSSYVANNMRVLENYGLMKYDGASVEYTIPTRIIKCGSRGNDAKWVQAALNRHGYNLIVDGIIGEKSEAAIIHFQKRMGLVPDGLVGPKTIAKL